MKLDCQSERGRRYLATQAEAANRLARQMGWSAHPTNNAEPADLDFVFTRAGVVAAVAEVKSRELSLAKLRGFGSYLITADKLDRGDVVSRALRVPFYVLAYLLEDEFVVCWQMTNASGERLIWPSTATTKTRANCNGGTAERLNAFLPLNFSTVLLRQ